MESSRDLAVTFAGGGNRAFYQVGFVERWWSHLEPRVLAVSACSAGASTAITWLSGRREEAHRDWLSRRDGITRNFRWSRLLLGQRPTPHEPIYRATLRTALAEGGLERIQALPFPVFILTAFPLLPMPLAMPVGMLAYSIERSLNPGKLHPVSGRKLGFRPVSVDARTCGSADQLADLILASSSTPPFLPIGRIGGHRVVDGGLVDNAPAFMAEAVAGVRRTLVLLTRPYPESSVGWRGSRLYLAPSGPVPINRWDYTSLERVERTLAMGRREAEGRAPVVDEFLNGGPTGVPRAPAVPA
jgi:predicted acylesterase/phospholipase RssA